MWRLVIGKFPIGTEVWVSADCFGEVESAEIVAFTNDKAFIALDTSSDGGWTNDTAWVDYDSLYATREAALQRDSTELD